MMARLRSRDGEAGLTLVELLVAMVIFAVFAGVVTSMIATMRSGQAKTVQTNSLNEQARLTLNRMARELRQAKAIEGVLVNASGTITGISFDVDFNGNGVIDTSSTDPERLTYCYQPPSAPGANDGKIMLTANTTVSTCGSAGSLPVLGSEVSGMTIELRSSQWQADGSCGAAQPPPVPPATSQPDGVTEWQELDCAAGQPYPTTPDATALNGVNSVVITLSVLQGSQTQVYRTQVDLRNKP